MYAATGEPNVKWGAPISMGGRASLPPPPLATALFISKLNITNSSHPDYWKLSNQRPKPKKTHCYPLSLISDKKYYPLNLINYFVNISSV